jgi:hypothetical protein
MLPTCPPEQSIVSIRVILSLAIGSADVLEGGPCWAPNIGIGAASLGPIVALGL